MHVFSIWKENDKLFEEKHLTAFLVSATGLLLCVVLFHYFCSILLALALAPPRELSSFLIGWASPWLAGYSLNAPPTPTSISHTSIRSVLSRVLRVANSGCVFGGCVGKTALTIGSDDSSTRTLNRFSHTHTKEAAICFLSSEFLLSYCFKESHYCYFMTPLQQRKMTIKWFWRF